MAKPTVQQLTRELKAHPVKAGLLALLGVVALWFWAPLVVGWFSGDDADQDSTSAAVVDPLPATNLVVTPAMNPAGGNTVSWKQLVELAAADPLKQSLAISDLHRDPFAPPPVPSADSNQNAIAGGDRPPFRPFNDDARSVFSNNETGGEANDQQQSVADLLGLTVMGTAIGNNKRSAVIDGRAVQEGEFVESADGKFYQVVHIAPRKVTVRADGDIWVLSQDDEPAPVDAPDGKIIIRRATS